VVGRNELSRIKCRDDNTTALEQLRKRLHKQRALTA